MLNYTGASFLHKVSRYQSGLEAPSQMTNINLVKFFKVITGTLIKATCNCISIATLEMAGGGVGQFLISFIISPELKLKLIKFDGTFCVQPSTN